jgi:hypothetical protein
MVEIILLGAVMAGQGAPATHVRTSEPQISALIEAGRRRSPTFRRLVATLDHSDVFVYVEAKKTSRQELGGYLSHKIVLGGGFRYVRVAIDLRGAADRLVPLLAHELQHAVEVSEHPDIHDEHGLVELFERIGVKYACARPTCWESDAAIDVQATVAAEIAAAH